MLILDGFERAGGRPFRRSSARAGSPSSGSGIKQHIEYFDYWQLQVLFVGAKRPLRIYSQSVRVFICPIRQFAHWEPIAHRNIFFPFLYLFLEWEIFPNLLEILARLTRYESFDIVIVTYRAFRKKLYFFPVDFHYFVTSPPPAIDCYWLYKRCAANRCDCTRRSHAHMICSPTSRGWFALK